MIRTNTFEKKYSILAPYITDEGVRKNMLQNKDLIRKYESNMFMIKAYITELDKRFDKLTINKFIVDTIFKFPDEVLVSFITAYLNSSEESKNNLNVVQFYKKVLSFGPDVIKYIEEHGIVTNRECKKLPQKIINDRFKRLEHGATYNGVALTEMFDYLSPNEKEILVEFLETNNYSLLDELFGNYFNLKTLLSLLKHTGISTDIINKENYNSLGGEGIQMIVIVLFSSLGDINIKNTINNIKTLLENKRYDLIHSLLINNMLIYAHYIDTTNIDSLSEEEMLDHINVSRVILEKTAA